MPERCENCGGPATTWDEVGVPLCEPCYQVTVAEVPYPDDDDDD